MITAAVEKKIALIGNPNCGKTTLFNGLTGARQKVGNWPGVTVEKKQGKYSCNDHNVDVVDLPGTYSLDAIDQQVSLDEKIARDFILGENFNVIVNILDASNLERNLYLTVQLLEMNKPIVVVVNMIDVAKEKGLTIDIKELEFNLGCPVVPVVASRKRGIEKLKNIIDQLSGYQFKTHENIYAEQLNNEILNLQAEVGPSAHKNNVDERWLATKILEGNSFLKNEFSPEQKERINQQQVNLKKYFDEDDLDIIFIDQRYQYIAGIVKKSVKHHGHVSKSLTDRIDNVVLNRVLGIPIFLLMMYLMFMITINIGAAFIDFFDIFFKTIFVDGTTYLLQALSAPDWLIAFLADGVGGGIQLVANFIPQIGLLFLFMSILEDSGYIARAAFVMDRLMRAIGLPGKSFVSMLVGFGCNVPSVMAARTLDNQRDRYLTIAMTPFMSCSARLSVYALFAASFFGSHGQNIVFLLYISGILMAIFTGIVLRHTLLPGKLTPFVMELPIYHMPTARSILLHTWEKLKGFVIRAGKAIVVVVVCLNILNSVGTDGTFGNQDTEKSILSVIGRQITPVFAPMGLTQDNWPATVGIFTGLFAKETVVGTLNAMYSQVGDYKVVSEDESFDFWGGIGDALATIPANLKDITSMLTDPLMIDIGDVSNKDQAAENQGVNEAIYGTMANLFPSAVAAFAYMLFILIYTPCVAALGAIYRETSMGWTIFVGVWTLVLAYMSSVVVFQVGTFLDHPVSSIFWLLGILVLACIAIYAMRRQGVLTTENDNIILQQG